MGQSAHPTSQSRYRGPNCPKQSAAPHAEHPYAHAPCEQDSRIAGGLPSKQKVTWRLCCRMPTAERRFPHRPTDRILTWLDRGVMMPATNYLESGSSVETSLERRIRI